MVIALFACLVVVAAYLAKRLSDTQGEIAVLRDQVTLLKRQLVKRRNGARA